MTRHHLRKDDEFKLHPQLKYNVYEVKKKEEEKKEEEELYNVEILIKNDKDYSFFLRPTFRKYTVEQEYGTNMFMFKNIKVTEIREIIRQMNCIVEEMDTLPPLPLGNNKYQLKLTQILDSSGVNYEYNSKDYLYSRLRLGGNIVLHYSNKKYNAIRYYIQDAMHYIYTYVYRFDFNKKWKDYVNVLILRPNCDYIVAVDGSIAIDYDEKLVLEFLNFMDEITDPEKMFKRLEEQKLSCG